MKSQIFLIAFAVFFINNAAFAQKNKSKNKPDLSVTVDSLSQRLGDAERKNQKLISENNSFREVNEQILKENKQLKTEMAELNRKIENQQADLKKIQDEISAKESAKRAETLTSMEFEATELDFGQIKEAAAVSKIYKLKNTGKRRLMFEKVEGSCGCTIAEWPRYPIEPGASAEVKVVFNSLGKRGPQNQTITITANTEPAQTVLRLKGIVSGE
jgi:predicted RNase H-like nuclease (RuvC/YqgF family)